MKIIAFIFLTRQKEIRYGKEKKGRLNPTHIPEIGMLPRKAT